MEFTLYILECADGSFYIGHTDDLGKRLEQHEQGNGCVYTSARRPLKLVHAEGFETRCEALTMERKLKGWSRAKKQAYMAGDWRAVGALAKGKHRHQRLPRGASTPLAAQATLSANGVGVSCRFPRPFSLSVGPKGRSRRAGIEGQVSLEQEIRSIHSERAITLPIRLRQ